MSRYAGLCSVFPNERERLCIVGVDEFEDRPAVLVFDARRSENVRLVCSQIS
jgi:hypothetical protein